ncbi:uncharacterized protein LOC100366565 [Saccoglossus kowalevskii]
MATGGGSQIGDVDSTSIDPLRILFSQLAREIDENEFTTMKQLLLGKQIPKEKFHKLNNALSLFLYLEEKGCISSTNLNLLSDLVVAIGRNPLLEIISTYQQQDTGNQQAHMPSTDTDKNASCQTLSDSREFQDILSMQPPSKWISPQMQGNSHSATQPESKLQPQPKKHERQPGELEIEVNVDSFQKMEARTDQTVREIKAQALSDIARCLFSKVKTIDDIPAMIKYLDDIGDIICKHIDHKCLVVVVECLSLSALKRLWQDYREGKINSIFQEDIVSEDVLRECGASKIVLTTTIERWQYRKCFLELQKDEETKDSVDIPTDTTEVETEDVRSVDIPSDTTEVETEDVRPVDIPTDITEVETEDVRPVDIPTDITEVETEDVHSVDIPAEATEVETEDVRDVSSGESIALIKVI